MGSLHESVVVGDSWVAVDGVPRVLNSHSFAEIYMLTLTANELSSPAELQFPN